MSSSFLLRAAPTMPLLCDDHDCYLTPADLMSMRPFKVQLDRTLAVSNFGFGNKQRGIRGWDYG